MLQDPLTRIRALWHGLYDGQHQPELEEFLGRLEAFKAEHALPPLPAEWYKDAVVYSLYVDLFAGGFEGLTERLEYLQGLGVTCLWLLPILDSPMKDAGFDIRDYRRVRADLAAGDADAAFDAFVAQAHARGLHLIFDIAMNHSSAEHPWFAASKDDPAAPTRDYYIWSDTDERYREARVIFKGMMKSNWTRYGEQFYFHRFFDIQPDLNYRNPAVLQEMTLTLLHWLARGVDGFRADAIPYLWKEEGTDCENLPKTHTIIRIFRAAMDFARPGSILLAEANQPPPQVARYFGDGDECLAAYHFPLMPRLYKALALADRRAITEVLRADFTPNIPETCQWFTFLRCHDELTLEMVTSDERRLIYEHYARDPLWDFREGEGISARLIDLMAGDARQVTLLNAILLTLLGTPILYYGDEFAKPNDRAYYDAQVAATGYRDSRQLVRGRVDWEATLRELADPGSLAAQVFYPLQRMLLNRRSYLAFSRGGLEFLDVGDDRVLAYARTLDAQRVVVLANLSGDAVSVPDGLGPLPDADLLGQPVAHGEANLTLPPYGYYWLGVAP
jgi:maltose alpha-D-glucosyltransferase / alpha-amylase